MSNKDALKLENQLCFPLYAASKEVIRRYNPLLKKLDLTYTQYLVMMVLWEEGTIGAKELGDKLFLDSGTLTPLIKKMQAKGYLEKTQSEDDLRRITLTITEKGRRLQDEAVSVPFAVADCVRLEEKDVADLYRILYEILHSFTENKEI
ncbi:MAG: MarR family transcriptional regulator [Erysipelotrichaceae bacterium]|nr:MarR family transcriptional regulator [Erysipelotrichaceae bacterium]MBQ1512395.1 MarR family transcriptional regulator [Erysipelotrichaceae bacterium]